MPRKVPSFGNLRNISPRLHIKMHLPHPRGTDCRIQPYPRREMAGSSPTTKRRTAAPELTGALWDRLAAAVDGLASEVAADRERAPLLLEELLAEPPSVRERMAVSLDRFRSPALAVLLVEQSLERKAAGGEL